MHAKNTPKLIFRRSWLYDLALKRGKDFKMPHANVLDAHVRKLEKSWKKHGQGILKAITQTTKLNWHEREIVCYITAGVIPYSDPLTLNRWSDIHTITHELIHRILSEPENWKKVQKNWSRIMKRYKHESDKTKGHVVVHAIHGIILEKYFGGTALEKEKKAIRDPNYVRSWNIAGRDGYQYIVGELARGIK